MLKGTPGTNRPEWKSEATHPDLSKKLKGKLNHLYTIYYEKKVGSII